MDIAFLTSAFRANQYPPPDRPEIAFAGKSNVGKSSLINVLVNRKGLARTSAKPGRTQSINFFTIGKSLYLVDLPGYGFARVPVKVKKSWQGMVETYLSERSNLKAVVVILDIRRDASSGDMDLLSWLKHYGIPAIPVLTKADKLSRQKARTRANVITRKLKNISPADAILFSAKTREGREEIWDKIRLSSGSDLQVPR
jgi:GTP-binding protein